MKIFFFIIIFPVAACAQLDSIQAQAEDIIEDVLTGATEESEESNLYDLLESLINEPVNLNEAGLDKLMQIPYVDLSIAEIIITHRKKFGVFFSVNELYSVQQLDPDVVRKIIPFVSVDKKIPPQQLPVEESFFKKAFMFSGLKIRSRVLNDLQERKAYRENKFPGLSYKIYNRVQLSHQKRYKAGLLVEKDPGESSLNEFTSFHFSAADILVFKKIIAGDYLAEFGQGLALWSPYGFSKSADAIFTLKKRDRNIREYTSADENQFFRGAAATGEFKRFSLTAFYSKNRFDANVDEFSGRIKSTPLDGLHRTASELSRRKSAEEKLYGGRVDYKLQNVLSAGILYYKSIFSNPFQPSSTFDIEGSEFSYASFYYDAVYSSINIFGEAAYNGTSVASINNFNISLNRFFTLSASVRSYPANFRSLHGYGFGEKGGEVSNEFGIYTGFRWRSPVGVINFYYDQFKFPYATFRIPLPSSGDEMLFNFSSRPFSKLETVFRYKYENKDAASRQLSNYVELEKRLKQNFRLDVIHTFSGSLRIKGRFEYVNLRFEKSKLKEEGYLLYQDIKFSPHKNLNLYGRISFFNTASFSSAIYEYENDLTGIITNLPMYGSGTRWYFIVRYKPVYFASLSLKYAETYKPNEKFLSSGDSEIEGNVDNRISFQLDVSL